MSDTPVLEVPTRRSRAGRAAATEATASDASDVEAVVAPVVVQTPEELVESQIVDMMSGNRNVNARIAMQEVRMYPHHVELEVNGMYKAISLMDFKQLIDSQLQTESSLDPMLLPFNTYVFAKSANQMQLSCYYPERRLNLKLLERYSSRQVEYKDMLMPNIIISHTLKAESGFWLVTDTRYFATNKAVKQLPEDKFVFNIGDCDGLWRIPLPNFYEEGRMCYGQNTMPVKYSNNLRGLDYYYSVLSDSPFNHDLGINVTEYRDNIEGWFEFLKTAKEFPYKMLRSRGY